MNIDSRTPPLENVTWNPVPASIAGNGASPPLSWALANASRSMTATRNRPVALWMLMNPAIDDACTENSKRKKEEEDVSKVISNWCCRWELGKHYLYRYMRWIVMIWEIKLFVTREYWVYWLWSCFFRWLTAPFEDDILTYFAAHRAL